MTEEMQYALNVSVEPDGEPIELEDVKTHLRVDDTTDDTLIEAILIAARQWLEEVCNSAFLTQTIQMQLDEWPEGSEFKIPRAPLQSVTSIGYTDEDGDTHTMSTDEIIVDIASKPGRIILKHDASWPSETLRAAAGITITYVAGYGENDDLPRPLRLAMLLLIGHWYENREAVVVGSGLNISQLPLAVRTLITNYRY